MRTWEVAIVGAASVSMLWTVVTGRTRTPWGHVLTAAAGGALYGHLRFEGWRWQMFPLYAVVGIMFTVAIWDLVNPAHAAYGTRPSRLKSFGPTLTGLLALAVATALPLALPIPELPRPANPVGTAAFDIVDGDRAEIYGPSPGDPRKLAVQIWYPAVTSGDGSPAPWVSDIGSFAPAAADYLALPPFALDHLRYATTGSWSGVPIRPGRHPVVVYSHGWPGFRSVALTQAEALADAGYVVVAVDHTYAALYTAFADGTGADLDPASLPDQDGVMPEEYAGGIAALVDTFVGDLRLVVDTLVELDAGTFEVEGVDFTNRLDLDALGVWGHSTGGGAAFELCAADNRCDAVLGLDPWVEPVDESIIEGGLEMPAAAIRSEEWVALPNDLRLQQLWSNSPLAEPLRCLSGTVHRDFTVLPYVSPVAEYLGLGGALGAERTDALVIEHLVSFFDEHLTGAGRGWENLSPPEVSGCG